MKQVSIIFDNVDEIPELGFDAYTWNFRKDVHFFPYPQKNGQNIKKILP